MALRTTTETLKMFRWLCQHGQGHESSDVFKVYMDSNFYLASWVDLLVGF